MEDIIIPKGYEAKIKGDKIVFIKEDSEDEKIRKELIDILKKSYEFGGFTLNNKKDLDRYLSYFEEQRCKERYDRMAPIYKDEESFESALDKAWKFYNESASATVDGFEDNAFELAFAKGFREGFLCKEEQKRQKSMRGDSPLSINVKTLEYIYNVCKGCMKQMSKEEFVKCIMSTIPKELVLEKTQKPEGRHYIKRNKLFEKWVQSCDPEIMKKVSDEIDEILKKGPESTFSKSEIGFADTYSKGVWEKLMLQFKNTEGYYIGCNDASDIVLNAILDTFKWTKSRQGAAEWSEKDKKAIERAIDCVRTWEIDYCDGDNTISERLKSLRPQPKQEWREQVGMA